MIYCPERVSIVNLHALGTIIHDNNNNNVVVLEITPYSLDIHNLTR